MKTLLLGFILGVFIASVVFFLLKPNPELLAKLGHELDKDKVYLKDGQILEGWIIKEDEENLWIEVGDGYFTLPYSQCKNIRKNVLSQYLQELM